MDLRRIAALVMLCLGAFLAYNGVHPLLTIMSRGSDLASALFEPPTTIIRLVASGLMTLGAILAVFRIKFGGTIALIGAVLFTALGALMAVSGADQGLWMDEVLSGIGAMGVAVLILTLRRI